MAVLLALLAAAGWGSSDFAAGHASRRSSAVSVVILTHLASVIALVAISLFPGQGGSPAVSDLLWGLAAGLGGGVGAMLLFRGLGKGSMSVVAPITATGAAMIPVIAGILQGESISRPGLIGIAIALTAILMVSLSAGDAAGPDSGVRSAHDDDPLSRLEAEEPDLLRLSPAEIDPPHRSPMPGPAPLPALDGPVDPAPRRPVGVGAAAAPGVAWAAPRGAPAATLPPPLALRRTPKPPPPPTPPPGYVSTFATPTNRTAGDTSPAVQATRGRQLPDVLAYAVDPARVAVLDPRDGAAVAAGEVHAPSSVPAPDDGDPVDSVDSVVPVVPVGETSRRSWRFLLRQPGLVEALFSGLGFGLFFVFIANASEVAGHWPLVGARFISVVMFAAAAILTSTAILPDRPSRATVTLAGLLDAAAAVFFVLATRAGLLSVGAVLASLYPAATVLLARVITNERIGRRQFFGLLLAGLAVSLLAI